MATASKKVIITGAVTGSILTPTMTPHLPITLSEMADADTSSPASGGSAAGKLATLRALLEARHSCRAFLPRPVPRETQRVVLETAQRTASWCNSQAWQVTLTEGVATQRVRKALLNHIAAGGEARPDYPFPRAYEGVYLQRRRECGLQLYSAVGVQPGDKEAAKCQSLRNFELFDAPHVAIVTSDDALGVYGAVDCGGWICSFLLACEAVGVAAIPQAALATYAPLVKQAAGIPMERRMVCAISFGYEDQSHVSNSYRTSRADVDEAAAWITQ